LIADSTRLRVSSLTMFRRLRTRETVLIDTLARSATSWIETDT
jgi:hypothetical protein